MSQQVFDFDVLVIGSGAAGLTLALRLGTSVKIGIISKGPISAGSTAWAQGGIAAVLHDKDSIESHVEDTLNAGAGLCKEETVRFVVEHGREAIEWLIAQGVPFSRREQPHDPTELHLTMEGGHSHRRVAHVADATGRAIEMSLESRARHRRNIRLFEDHTAVDLVVAGDGTAARCVGAYVYDNRRDQVDLYRAPAVVLATGGASRVYLYTTNPDASTGDGIAMAWRAGCRVANMEFNQFHPTCLYHPEARNFLISEALRGEGAKLKLPDGSTFMQRFDPRAELAPRDIVARAIDHEMKRLGIDCVYLDISHQPAEFIMNHFPTIYSRCLKLGFDLTRQPIPVVPAAHYTCGGVVTDLKGRTDIAGLYAIGEVTCTGLHGANRMASNSLLECLVFGAAAAEDIGATLASLPAPPAMAAWDESRVTDSDEEVVVSHNWNELRHFMWDYVGIVRTDKRLERAARRVDLLAREIRDYYRNFRVTKDLLELRNLVVVADLIVRSAMARKESRGLHYTTDYPEKLPGAPQDTVLTPTPRPV
ncbi:MAG: L-aspartate oxidase [Proteobacteria bacterium]|nr:MAG: L-aspartate oxidase [Pseudomonadota bacterium]